MEWLIVLMLQKHAVPGAVPASVLAPAIVRTAEKYNLDPVLITKLIMVESRGLPQALNRNSKDYGLMQINVNTAKAYGYSAKCLMAWQCNLDAGAKILVDLKKHKGYRACMYNLGPRKARVNPETCARYEQRLAFYD